MKEEMFDTYTREGEYLGVKSKSFCHSPNVGIYHKVVWVWIINEKGEVLVQKRAMVKKLSPGLYDMPSAGHVDAGEELVDACIRETLEELGVKTEREDYEFLGEHIADEMWEIGHIYLLKLPSDTVFKLEETEVELVKWLTLDEFRDLFYSDKFVKHGIEYKDKVVGLFEKKL